METKYISVLDYVSGEVHIYTTTGINSTEQAEKFIQRNDHKLKDCEFMITEDLILHIHQEQ